MSCMKVSWKHDWHRDEKKGWGREEHCDDRRWGHDGGKDWGHEEHKWGSDCHENRGW